MINKILSEIKAYRHLIEVDVDPDDDGKITAAVKFKFLTGDGWKGMGRMMASFSANHYEFRWATFDLPVYSREFFEHKTIEAIKKKISLIWGFERMLEFERRVETSILK